ncbi:GerAB/ArcD/ProY family transporter [Ectobacillus panaciterrae]|uniref:GerAB/ArcD/ProY family transporter n=1 Tax=Ectobacillus panaciterrae TaxID=363872 RepID=UPI0003F4E830|nr:endospore germination permease [Ectobacillus panaciterrae]
MKKYAYNEITLMQYIFLIHGAQFGIGVLQLPRILAEKAGMDGWIPIIFGWMTSVIGSLIIIQIMKKYPEGTLFDLFTKYFGKWAGKAIALFMALYFAFVAFTIVQRSILFIQVWIVPGVSGYVLMILFAIPTYTIARNGIRIIGRYAELVFFLILWMPLFYWFALRESHHWIHLLPLFKDMKKALLATQSTIYSFLGVEIAFFLYPFLQKKQAASIGIIIANLLSMLVFLFVTLTCYIFFSPDEITLFNEPTLSILKVVEFRFVERMEIIFLAFYLLVLSRTWMPYMYGATFCSSWLFGKQDHSKHLLLLLLLLVLVTYFDTPTFNQNDLLQEWGAKLGSSFVYIFSLFLWIYLSIRERIRGRAAK